MRSMTSHSTAFFSITLSTVRMLLTVFGAFVLKRRLEALHVFALDRVESLVTERRHQVHAEDHLLRRDPARLLPIRPRVAVEESRRELS